MEGFQQSTGQSGDKPVGLWITFLHSSREVLKTQGVSGFYRRKILVENCFEAVEIAEMGGGKPVYPFGRHFLRKKRKTSSQKLSAVRRIKGFGGVLPRREAKNAQHDCRRNATGSSPQKIRYQPFWDTGSERRSPERMRRASSSFTDSVRSGCAPDARASAGIG